MSFRRTSSIAVVLVGAAALAIGCMQATASAAGAPAVAPASAATRPRLVVFITVDQLRGNMLDRYASDLHGGYARLMHGGAWFTNAFQDHAITETAPGHASTMSGRFPRSTGIWNNTSGGVNGPAYPLIDALASEPGAAPERFNGTTLFDWLHARDMRSRALSVSRKDRGAILPIGRSKQDVYWYSGAGTFTTSTWYRDTLPAWVRDFNARHIPQSFAGYVWDLALPIARYAEPDSVPFENGGRNFMFPHGMPDDPAVAARALAAIPAMDSVTALFALEGLQRLHLGEGPQTDVLAMSLSTTDAVGHAYGPDSREAHDNEVRVDQTIGWFIDSLYKLRDSSTIVIALTGDHGASPIPELAHARGEARGDEALRVSLRQQVLDVRAGLRAVGADTDAFQYESEVVAIDRAAVARAKLNADSILDAFAAAAKRVPGVWRVDRIKDLRRANPSDFVARRWTHQIPLTLPIDLVITLTKGSNFGTIPATHGTPWDQDASVPVIFYGPWFRPGRYSTFARTVDMAPTLAAVTGVPPLEKLDGVVLTEAIR